MGKSFWKKDFWKVAMASMLGLAPTAAALDIGGGSGKTWSDVANGDSVTIIGNVADLGAAKTVADLTVVTGASGIESGGKLTNNSDFQQDGGVFTIATGSGAAWMKNTGSGTIAKGASFAIESTTGDAWATFGDLSVLGNYSVISKGGDNANTAISGLTQISAGGSFTINAQAAGKAFAQHDDLTVMGQYLVKSDGSGDANTAISGLTAIQTGGSFQVISSAGGGNAFADHGGDLVLMGQYAVKSDGGKNANSAVGGDLKLLGGQLSIHNSAGSGVAKMVVANDATLSGAVAIKNESSAVAANAKAASLEIAGATAINSGANVQISSGAGSTGLALLSSDGKVAMTGGKVALKSAASAGSTGNASPYRADNGAYFHAKGDFAMSGGEVNVSSASGAVASFVVANTADISGGEIIVKGAGTAGWSSVEANIYNITGGKLVVGDAANSRSTLLVGSQLNIADKGVVEIGGKASGLYSVHFNAGAGSVTVGRGGVFRTNADATVGATAGSQFTVDEGGALDLNNGGMAMTNVSADIKGDLIMGAGANGLNTLGTNGAITVADKDNIKIGVSVWENYTKIKESQDMLQATGGLTITGVADLDEWTYEGLVGDVTVVKNTADLKVKALRKTDVSNPSEVLAKLGKMGYDVEKFGDGAVSLLGGVITGYQGNGEGVVFDASGSGQFNKSFYDALMIGASSFAYVDTFGNARTVTVDKQGGFIDYIFGNTDSAVAQIGLAGVSTNLGATSGIMGGNSNLFAQVSNAVGSDSGLAATILNDRFLNRLWVGGFGLWEDADRRDGIDGFKYKSGGFMTGFDRAFGPVIAGVNFSYTKGDFENKAAIAHDSDIEIYSFNGYATYNHCSGFFGGLLGGYSHAKNDIRENYGNMWAQDDFHTDSWYVGGKFGYNWSPVENLWISPSVGVLYLESKSSAHDSWSQSASLVLKRVGSMKYDTATIPVDVTVNYDVNFANCGKLSLSANVGYSYNFDSDGPTGIITQQGLVFANGMNGEAGEMNIKSRDTGHHTLNLGAGAKYTFGRFDVGVKYDYYRKASYDAHRVSGTFGVSF